jgi:hypothetical protein
MLLQGVSGLSMQKIGVIGAAVFEVPGNRQTDGQTDRHLVNYGKKMDTNHEKFWVHAQQFLPKTY